MNLLLLLSAVLPKEILPEVFFRIHPPSEEDFLEACRNGKSLLVERWLFYSLVDVSVWYDLPISIAAERGDLHLVSLLLEHGASAYGYKNMPIVRAAEKGCAEVVSLLLDHGASAVDNVPILWAGVNCHTKTISILLAHGADDKVPLPVPEWYMDSLLKNKQ